MKLAAATILLPLGFYPYIGITISGVINIYFLLKGFSPDPDISTVPTADLNAHLPKPLTEDLPSDIQLKVDHQVNYYRPPDYSIRDEPAPAPFPEKVDQTSAYTATPASTYLPINTDFNGAPIHSTRTESILSMISVDPFRATPGVITPPISRFFIAMVARRHRTIRHRVPRIEVIQTNPEMDITIELE